MAGTARSQSTDPFSSNRFHVVDSNGLLNFTTPAAGFNNVTAPEANIGSVEYQEGINAFRRKYAGETTFTPITLSKGVVKNDSTFFRWLRAASENKPYRTNLIIRHFHRDDVSGLIDYKTATANREIHCFNAFPIRVRSGSDFDSLSADISIEEVEVELEYFRIFLNGQEVTSLDGAD